MIYWRCPSDTIDLMPLEKFFVIQDSEKILFWVQISLRLELQPSKFWRVQLIVSWRSKSKRLPAYTHCTFEKIINFRLWPQKFFSKIFSNSQPKLLWPSTKMKLWFHSGQKQRQRQKTHQRAREQALYFSQQSPSPKILFYKKSFQRVLKPRNYFWIWLQQFWKVAGLVYCFRRFESRVI